MRTIIQAILVVCFFLYTVPGHAAVAPQPLKSIGVSVNDLGNPFFVQIGKGIETAAKQLGGDDAKVSLVSCGYDSNRQIGQIEQFIASKVDMIVLTPADSKLIAPAIRKAKAAGIVVVALDSATEGGVDATVTSNNYMAGEQACSYIADRLHGAGEIIILNGPQITTVKDRIDGCKDVLSDYPAIKVLSDDQNAEGSREGGLRVTSALLAKNPKVDAIFATNDPTAIGAELAAKQAKRTDLFITGVDGSPEAEKAMQAEDGLFVATPAQDPRHMAIKAVETGFRFMQGRRLVNTIISTPTKLITKDNLPSYKGWTSE